ncbi:MAG: V-type ATP synthase subunit D, partial [Victivallaceae bacterium]
MAKIKFTKTEMKQQQDALKRYRRFLPTLQLKKQQLQFEMRLADEKLAENERRRLAFMEELDAWVALFGDDVNTNFIGSLIKVERIISGVSNIAGVSIPVFEKVEFSTVDFDYFVNPS